MLHRSALCCLFTVTRLLRVDDGNGLFERYTEIDNSNSRKIEALEQLGLCNDEWIGTEKVHGANFGIYSMDHGKQIRFAKRSGLMPPTEHFFGYHALIPQFHQYIHATRALLETRFKVNPHTIILNGELFGGKYDHPNVPRNKTTVMVGGRPRHITAVQTDPFPQYSPNLHFYAFDIKYTMEAQSPYRLLTYDEALSIFEAIPDLLHAKAIIRGPMSKVAAFDVEHFETTIPPLVGMGNYPLKGNWAEGLVVKHCRRGEPGFDVKGQTILKFKCTAFQEITTDRRDGPRVDAMENVRRTSINKSGVQLPELESVIRDKELLEHSRLLLNHVCENRLKSVLSKIGTEPFERQIMSPNTLADLLARDALKDFLKEAPSRVVNTSILLRRSMAKYTLFEARKLVCAEWKNILARQRELAE